MTRFAPITTIAAALAFATPAEALLARAWVSGKGVDSAGCGPASNPCRQLQYVHDNIIAPGGEIDIMDPAGYGALTIAKALTVVNDGVGVAGLLQSTDSAPAVLVAAGANDAVHLRGLTLDGAGVASDGIQFFSGGALEIVSCTIRHFARYGLWLSSGYDSRISIVNTRVAGNAAGGVYISAGSLANVRAVARGLDVVGTGGGPGVVVAGDDTEASKTIEVVIADSLVSNNFGEGIWVTTSAGKAIPSLTLTNVVASANGVGVGAGAGAIVRLSRSVISNNRSIAFKLAGGTIQSYGDNVVAGNWKDNVADLTPVALH